LESKLLLMAADREVGAILEAVLSVGESVVSGSIVSPFSRSRGSSRSSLRLPSSSSSSICGEIGCSFPLVILVAPTRSVGVVFDAVLGGARAPIVDVRGCVLLVAGALFKAPPMEVRDVDLVLVGGPIEGRAPVLNRDFVLESEVLAVVAGVPVRGVDAFELAEETVTFVGDFVGD
jgi:hypothetical protein